MGASSVQRRQTGSHWGVYDVLVGSDGRLKGQLPSPLDPHPSLLNAGLPEAAQSDLRITQPHVRASYLREGPGSRGDRGRGPFVPVTWERALALVAHELASVKEEHGNEAIYGGSYGWASAGRLHHAPSLLKRFLGLHGGFVDKRGNHSWGAAFHIMPYVIGRSDISQLVIPWPAMLNHTQLVVMFGGAPIKNAAIANGGETRHETPEWIARAGSRDIKFVCVSPSRADTLPAVTCEWMPIRPNTDVAFMLALAHVLDAERLADYQFLSQYCVGFQEFKRYLTGETDGIPKSPEWASEVTQASPETIRLLARRMASNRTLITTSWSIQRADHGEQPYWMTVVLAAMLGQIGIPGGGFSFGFGANSNIANPRNLDVPRPTIPLGKNAVRCHVPVAMVGDMLLNPGKTIDYNGSELTYPDIRLIHSLGGNPFHHNTNLNRFLQAWQRPDTVIVHEAWWNPVSRHADIVLPCTTALERNDILAAELGRHWVAMYQAIPPVHQARNDFDILADLSARLGFDEEFTEGRDEMAWLKHMFDGARTIALQRGYAPPTFEEFWEQGSFEFPLAAPEGKTLLEEFRRQPLEWPLGTPSGKIEIFSQKICSYNYADCLGHPAWFEPEEWLGGAKSASYPLHLLSNQPATRLHSQNDMSSVSRAGKIERREPITLSSSDALARGISSGDVVRVYNDRGEFLAAAIVSSDLMCGVAQIATGAWYDPEIPGHASLEKHGNPNVVTTSKGTSRLGQSSTAQTCLVEVEKLRHLPPPVTAFDLPQFTSATV